MSVSLIIGPVLNIFTVRWDLLGKKHTHEANVISSDKVC